MDLKLRDRCRSDQAFMEEMLYEAIYIHEGGRPDRSIIQDPSLARYIKAWTEKDICVIAEVGEKTPVGACWLRWFPKEDPGYGFYHQDVPELSIAVLPAYRGLGIGKRLIEAAMEALPKGVKKVSLSVDDRNPAIRLYRRLEFRIVSVKGHSVTMLFQKKETK